VQIDAVARVDAKLKVGAVGETVSVTTESALSRGAERLSQSEVRLHFGVGRADTVEIEVRWPSGAVDRHSTRVNRIVIVDAGNGPRP
jgi:hypothetical protein